MAKIPKHRERDIGRPCLLRWWDASDRTGEFIDRSELKNLRTALGDPDHEEIGFYLGRDNRFIYFSQLKNKREIRNLMGVPLYSIDLLRFWPLNDWRKWIALVGKTKYK